ncbi:MAG: putative metal-binding motif-containing protein [Deltaproteobacteria bacterium]|nr:putative metal-binding motif-containing protein [Deltaproteobacteria bacterium]
MLPLVITAAAVATATLLAACSSGQFDIAPSAQDAATDGAASDGSISGDAGADAITPTCDGKPTGAPCGPDDGTRRICVAGACVVSRCGDAVIDPGEGEVCDDGNTLKGDGCDPESCAFSCTKATDCDDGNGCTIGETCDLAAHRCTSGSTASKGTPCVRSDGAAGVCNGTTCAAPGCGNGVVDVGEQCDDCNAIEDDGCRSDCRYTCTVHADCDDKNVCNGLEACDSSSHRCVPGTPLVCDDGNACTTDTCSPTTGCKSALVDADGDGHAPASLGSCGTDCNDGDPSAYKGAAEVCDGVDNDCDGSIDEGVLRTCYADGDGDGFGLKTVASQRCACPAGTTDRADLFDCADGVLLANPAQASFFATGYSTGATTSFDYDCDGKEQLQDMSLGGCGADGVGGCITTKGWRATELPACGMAQAYVLDCKLTAGVCQPVTGSRVQACR